MKLSKNGIDRGIVFAGAMLILLCSASLIYFIKTNNGIPMHSSSIVALVYMIATRIYTMMEKQESHLVTDGPPDEKQRNKKNCLTE